MIALKEIGDISCNKKFMKYKMDQDKTSPFFLRIVPQPDLSGDPSKRSNAFEIRYKNTPYTNTRNQKEAL